MQSSRTVWIGVVLLFCAGCSRDAAFYLAKGNQLFSSGQYDAASLNYRKAIGKDSKSAEAYLRLGLCEQKQNHFLESWQNVNRAAELAPTREDILKELGNLCLVGLVANPSRPANL